jgi:hypothetical protein
VLSAVRESIKPLIDFESAALRKEVGVRFAPSVSVAPLSTLGPSTRVRSYALRLFPVRVDVLKVFTKRLNLNKLYVDSTTGIFLSPGIVLKFMKQDSQRFLKKRLKVWHNYIKALRFLQKRPFVAYFKGLSGKKSIFFNKLKSGGVKIRWAFVKLFSSHACTGTKRTRRIKRWIKKKYYQLGVGERK